MKRNYGDLLTSKSTHIIHNCNCFCNFGGGIANQISRIYPEAYTADCSTLVGDRNKLGVYTYTYVPYAKKTIFNVYGQYGHDSNVVNLDFSALKKGIKAVRVHLDDLCDPNIIVGIPWQIGCGLAGGDWKMVKPMIESLFATAAYTVEWWSIEPENAEISLTKD